MTKRLRRAAWFLSAVGFAAAQSPPPNDAWASPALVTDGINPEAPTGADGELFSNAGADDSPGFAAGYRDVFFLYVATAGGTAAFSTCPAPGYPTPSATNLFVELYAATGGPPLASNVGACGAGAALSATVVAGTSYVVRVGSATGAGEGTFRLTVARAAALGDAATTAADLGSGPAFAFAFETPAGATPDATSALCPNSFVLWYTGLGSGPPLADVWATFTPTVTGRLFHTNPTAPAGVGSGATTWPDLRYGIEPVGGGGAAACLTSHVHFGNAPLVAAGTTYLMRLAAGAATPHPFAVSFRVVPIAPDCANPAPAALGPNAFNLLAPPQDDGCAPSGVQTTWFSFMAPASGVVDVLCTAEGLPSFEPSPGIADGWQATVATPALMAYEGACDGGVRLTGPVAGTARFAATAGTTYFLRVSTVVCTGVAVPFERVGAGTLTLSYGTPVVGDSCATALPFVGDVSIGSSAGATFDGTPFAPCATPSNATLVDLWHVFTASASGPLLVAGAPHGYAVYDSCGAAAPISCATAAWWAPSPPPLPAFDAVAGQSYLIRVASLLPNGLPSAPPTYTLTILGAAPNDECAGATTIYEGANPTTGSFELALASPSPAPYYCWNPNGPMEPFVQPPNWPAMRDLFFQHVATATGPLAVQAVRSAGSSADSPALFVYDAATCVVGGAPFACSPSGRVVFSATAGASYVLRAVQPNSSLPSFGLNVGPPLEVLSTPSSGVFDEDILEAGANESGPWICGGWYWSNYGFLIAVGAPAATPHSFDVEAPGLFPPGSLLFVEPSTAALWGPAPMNPGSSFCVGGPPILDPSLWGMVVAAQAFTVAAGPGGASVLRATNGVVVALGV